MQKMALIIVLFMGFIFGYASNSLLDWAGSLFDSFSESSRISERISEKKTQIFTTPP